MAKTLMARASNPVQAAQILFYTNTLIWVLFGFISLVRMTANGPGSSHTAWVIALLMFGNAGAMLAAGLGLAKRSRLFYFFAIMVLVVNIILTITDQFGWLDLITLIIDLFLFGLLIFWRTNYLEARRRNDHLEINSR